MKRVTLTREPPRNDEVRRRLEGRCFVHELPWTTTHSFEVSEVDGALEQLGDDPQTIVVTSARAAASAARAQQRFPRAIVVAVGPATLRALELQGVSGAHLSPALSATSIAGMNLAAPVLSLGALHPRPELANGLTARGLVHTHVAVYETVPRVLTSMDQDLLATSDVVVIGAPSAWEVAAPHIRPETVVVVQGTTTAEIVRENHPAMVIAATPEEIERALF
ncbi:MAG: uroporphyrinogen-III synthase [Actinomycetes bacterium]